MASPLPLTAADPTRLGGYEILGRLGTGGQGVVYLGRPLEEGPGVPSRVAVKLLHAQLLGNAAARARFVREMALLRRVAGFCTAQMLAADMDGDRPYIVSEYVPGRSLRELVHEQGPRTGADLDRLAIGTVTALTAIHRAGVVHRDFKPQNVLMGLDGPRVIDFGVARAFDAGATLTSQVVGTPAYMAPEQFAGRVSPATDLFAWAATLLFAATGRDPFAGGALPAVMYRIMHETPDLGALPGPVAEIAAACLAKDPKARPTSEDVLLRLLGDRAHPPHPRLNLPAPPAAPPAGPSTGVLPEPPTATWTTPAGAGFAAGAPAAVGDGAGGPSGPVSNGALPFGGRAGGAASGTGGAADAPTADARFAGFPPGAEALRDPGVEDDQMADPVTRTAYEPRPAGGSPRGRPASGTGRGSPAPEAPWPAAFAGGQKAATLPAPGGTLGVPARTYRRLRRGPGIVAGLVLAALLAVLDVAALAILIARPALTSGHRGGLLPVVAASFALVAVVTLVAVIVAWRGSRAAAWTVLAARVVRVAMWAGWGALVTVQPSALAGHAALTALVVLLLAQGLWSS
ncbi:serine/threonine-protein kinase [Actinomadura opuntiae]|uniref:serine/threonine-protein kinase n=1 Tax=Actinomadura sp. OS1-43 TaxID=604315 RepID=UPI00255A9E4E|nr:serine/threonine-protein kinase [Actinomadura sp. OS1-43]MDL4819508.1 serine/threonine-protein kinase [Actinomadura sp. OS1-43]